MAKTGRSSAKVATQIREKIDSGSVSAGQYLPTVQKLCEEHGVANRTVLRAMKSLESAGLIESEPRQGYRVLARAHDPNLGCPIAYVLSAQMAGEEWTGLNRLLLTSLQTAASTHGWSLLGTGAKGVSGEDIINQCRASRAWGVIMDVHSPEIIRPANEQGFTVVMVDAWHEDADVDCIIQDGFHGGFIAADYLAEKGHEKIGWVGSVSESIHSMTRFSGAASCLRKRGIPFAETYINETSGPETYNTVRTLLSKKNRPTSILTLWRERALEAARAIEDAGLELGKDIDLVGWCAEEQFNDDYANHFKGAVVPAVTWSINTLAETAVERLYERRAHPDLPPVRINIETRLKLNG